jgi:hypothetical protein
VILTASAATLIREVLSRTSLPDPVVYLIEASPARPVPPEAGRAILRGDNKDVIRKLMLESTADTLKEPKRLLAAIYPRAQFLRVFLTKVGDLFFVCPPHMRFAMRNAILDVAGGNLVLSDRKGNVLLPRQRVK